MISISQDRVIQVYMQSRYLSFSFCSVEQYAKNERDKTVVDLNPDEICTEREKRMNIMSSFPLGELPIVKYYFSHFVKIALRPFSKQ